MTVTWKTASFWYLRHNISHMDLIPIDETVAILFEKSNESKI